MNNIKNDRRLAAVTRTNSIGVIVVCLYLKLEYAHTHILLDHIAIANIS